MNIGLYKEPINTDVNNYRGLYRCNSIVDSCYSNFECLNREFDWYCSSSRNGIFLDYEEKTANRLIHFLNMLQLEMWDGEIILFTDEIESTVPPDYKFLGYDICADSMYYSPLGDGFLNEFNYELPFFSEMTKEEYFTFKNDLNNCLLFQSLQVALEFALYCRKINRKFEHSVESEDGWRPLKVYRWEQETSE